ncbi:MAG TPA: NAD(P)-dependent alcohol dehydrogenase [Xanthobacteraceae bacterium]|nr:NAD(P)-dependent alcohol dehydrogenase [Xanthobacteraceae bacterium]
MVSLEEPRPDEVLVRIVATGMCHTDLVIRDQVYPVPMPIVLGHEGAGIVERVGAAVRKVLPGDHVVLSFMSCGHCGRCAMGQPAYCEKGHPLCFGGTREDGSTAMRDTASTPVHDHFFGQSSFGTYALANERTVVKVPKDLPLERLGPLGCGVQTGAGAVMNALKIGPGASFAAFGSGSVGLSAIMAAKVVGATTVIAVDVIPSRLALAKELGATHTVNPTETDPIAAIRAATNGGADFALETTGLPAVVRLAVDALGTRGTCGIVGAAPIGTTGSFDMGGLMSPGKGIRGIIQGDSVPELFIPQLIELHRQGRFPFDRLLKFYSFDDINQAAADSETGVTIKPVLRMG